MWALAMGGAFPPAPAKERSSPSGRGSIGAQPGPGVKAIPGDSSLAFCPLDGGAGHHRGCDPL